MEPGVTPALGTRAGSCSTGATNTYVFVNPHTRRNSDDFENSPLGTCQILSEILGCCHEGCRDADNAWTQSARCDFPPLRLPPSQVRNARLAELARARVLMARCKAAANSSVHPLSPAQHKNTSYWQFLHKPKRKISLSSKPHDLAPYHHSKECLMFAIEIQAAMVVPGADQVLTE